MLLHGTLLRIILFLLMHRGLVISTLEAPQKSVPGTSNSTPTGQHEEEGCFADYANQDLDPYLEITETVLFKINISDVWKDVEEVKINISDSWKTVTEMKININDSWRQIF
jgi:hypothetical protein